MSSGWVRSSSFVSGLGVSKWRFSCGLVDEEKEPTHFRRGISRSDGSRTHIRHRRGGPARSVAQPD